MSEKDITRWHDTITPRDKAPQPWAIGSGGSWDILEVQPIPDAMLAELAQRYHYAGTPWNCRSMPLSESDREYMYLLYSCMQGLVARMRQAERKAAEVPQWRPIETAPKDGSVFLGWVAAERWTAADGECSSSSHDTSQVDFCWWRPMSKAIDGGYFDNGGGLIGDAQDVTHWMPLPVAPAAEVE